jgi:hypothetical protein
VHTAHAEAEIACNRGYAVIGELEALVGEHPYREPLWMQLMTAYYLAERQSDALDAYQRLKSTLAEDLGIDPGPSVRVLHERILRQEPLNVRKTAQTTAVHSNNKIDMRTRWHADHHGASPVLGLPRAAAIRSRGDPDRAARRQRRRARRRQRQPPPRGHHRHRHQLCDHRPASANGVDVGGVRIRGTAMLGDGDRVTSATASSSRDQRAAEQTRVFPAFADSFALGC